MARRLSIVATGLLCILLLAAGCKNEQTQSTPGAGAKQARSLYARLGGEPGIRALVNDVVARAAADPGVNFYRKGTPGEWNPSSPSAMDTMKEHIVQFVAQATGGPVVYEGRDMRTVHAGMAISTGEFNALLKDIQASMDTLSIGAQEQKELLAIVESTRKDIVEVR